MPEPVYLKPFVLPTTPSVMDRRRRYDLYTPGVEHPCPAIVFVHGLYSSKWRPTARDWPTYVGYGTTATSYGAAGVVVDVPLHDPSAYPHVADVVADVVEDVRRDPRVDGRRMAVWCFSGGGLLTARWLREPPSWLRCLALSYPVLAPLPGWQVDPAFRPAEELTAEALPIVLTRAGRDVPEVAATVASFLARAQDVGARVDLVDVPEGQHGFDSLEHTDGSRDAVRAAFRRVMAYVTASNGCQEDCPSHAG